jgi:hypothetical protein
LYDLQAECKLEITEKLQSIKEVMLYTEAVTIIGFIYLVESGSRFIPKSFSLQNCNNSNGLPNSRLLTEKAKDYCYKTTGCLHLYEQLPDAKMLPSL